MIATRDYEIHFDLPAYSRGDGGYRWSCTRCPESSTAETEHAAEVVAQAHAETHAVRRGW